MYWHFFSSTSFERVISLVDSASSNRFKRIKLTLVSVVAADGRMLLARRAKAIIGQPFAINECMAKSDKDRFFIL